MAVTYVGTGAAAVAATAGSSGAAITASPAYHASWANNDLGVLIVASGEAAGLEPTVQAGWKYRGSLNGGAGTFGAGVGPRKISFFTRTLKTGDDTTPTVTLDPASGTTHSLIAAVAVFRKSSTERWVLADGKFGSDSSAASTAFTATTTTELVVDNGDMVIGAMALCDTLTVSSQNITTSGATIGARTEIVEQATENGNDLALNAVYASVTAGPSSGGGFTVTGTLSSNDSGSAGVFRVRSEAITDLRAAHTGLWRCAHRGAQMVHPEETLEAYAACYADPGYDVLEIDARISASGTIWCSHDANTSRLGTTTVTIATATDAQIEAVVFNNASADMPVGWTGTYKFAKLEDVLALYGDKILISVEPKTLATGQALPALIDQYIVDKDNIVFPSFDDTYTEDLVAAGYKIAVRDESPTTAATMLAKGAVQTNIQLSGAPQSWVEEVQAAGVEVWVWTINTQNQYNTAVGRGVKGVISDDPKYVSGLFNQTTDPYDTQKAFTGYVSAGTTSPVSTRGLFTAPDEWGIDNDDGATAGVESAVLQGWANPINGDPDAPAWYTIDFEAKMISVRSGVANITVGIATDDLVHFAGGANGGTGWQGYAAFQRRNGNNHIRRNDGDGTDTTLTDIDVPGNLTLDTWYTYQLVVTPTDITFTNVTTGETCTTSDSTYTKGNYIWFGAAGSDARYRNVVITDDTPAVTPISGSDTSSAAVSDSATVVITSTTKSASDTGAVAASETTATTAGVVSAGGAAGPITINLLGEGVDGGSSTTYSSTSIAPAANKIVVLALASGVTGDHTLSSVTGLGLTWNAVVSRYGNNNKAHLYWAYTGSSTPTAGAITFTFGSSVSKVAWKAVELSNADLSTPIVQSGGTDGTTTPQSFSLSGVNTNNAVFEFAVGNSSAETYTPGTGYTKIGSDSSQTGPSMQSSLAWDASGVNTVDYDISGGAFRRILIGMEVARGTTTAGDTGSVAAADVSSIEVTTPTVDKSASDTGSMVITESRTTTATRTITDSGSVTVSESVTTQASRTITDSGSVAISENVAITVTTATTDTASVAATDATLIHKTIPTTDTSSVSVADVATVVITHQEKTATDTGAVAVSETVLTTATLSVTETGSVAAADASLIQKSIPASDTGAVAASDISTVLITEQYKAASDTSSVAIADTSGTYKTIPATDSGAVTASESTTTFVSVTGTDTSSVAVSESVQTAVSLARTDTSSVAGADTSSTFTTLSASDSSTVAVTDAAAVHKNIPGSDSGAVSIVDESVVDVVGLELSASDTSEVAVTESTSFGTVSVSANDTAGLAISDSAARAASGVVSDSAQISITESSQISATVTSTDTTAVLATESTSTLTGAAASDSAALAADDSGALEPVEIASVDAGSLAVSEDAETIAAVSADDEAGISLDEVSSFETVEVTASDTDNIGVIDSGFVGGSSIPGNEEIAVSVQDDAELLVTFTDTDEGEVEGSEESATFLTIDAEDESAVTVEESQSIFLGRESSDEGAVAIEDEGLLDTTSPALDFLTIALAESVTVFVTLAANDASAITVTDTSGGDRQIVANDELSVIVTDTGFQGGSANVTDSGSVAVEESTETFVRMTRTDAGSVAAADSVHTHKSIAANDTGGVRATETKTIIASVNATDTSAVSIVDSNVIDRPQQATDNTSVGVDDVVGIVVFTAEQINVSDTLSVAVEESAQTKEPAKEIRFDSKVHYDIMLSSGRETEQKITGSREVRFRIE